MATANLLSLASLLACSEAEGPPPFQGTVTVSALDGSTVCDGEQSFSGDDAPELCPDCDYAFALRPAEGGCGVPPLSWGPSERAPDVFFGYAASTYIAPRERTTTYDSFYTPGYDVGEAWFLSYELRRSTIDVYGAGDDDLDEWAIPFNDDARTALAFAWEYGVIGEAHFDSVTLTTDGFSATGPALDPNVELPRAALLWETCAEQVADLPAPMGKDVKGEGTAGTLTVDGEVADRWTVPVTEGQLVELFADGLPGEDGKGDAEPEIYILRPDGCLAAGPDTDCASGGECLRECSNGGRCPQVSFTANVAGDWGFVVRLSDGNDRPDPQAYTILVKLDGEKVTPTLDIDEGALYGDEVPSAYAVRVEATIAR